MKFPPSRKAGLVARPRILARIDWAWVVAVGGAASVGAAVLSAVVFGRIPHVQDSIAMLFQARIFAAGRLWAPAPPLPGFFQASQVIISDGRWYSQYPPGHPLLLVPGVWLGAPWLVNPLLGGLAVAGVYFLALEVFDRPTARVAAILGALSPFLLLMSAEFMSHAGSLFALTFYLLFHFRMMRRRSIADGLAAGFFLGLAVLVRPYSACGMALPAMGHGLVTLWRERRVGNAGRERGGFRGPLFQPLALAVLGAVAGGVLLLLYNWGSTGNPLEFGYTKLYGPSHGIGFGKGSWGPPHTLGRGLGQTYEALVALNGRLFEWPGTSLWPLALGLALPPWGRAAGRRWLLALFPLSLLGLYVFYWYHDLCFGPRLVYEALGPILAISATGLVGGVRWIAARRPSPRGGRLAAFLGIAVVAVLFGVAGLVRWPRLFLAPPGTADLPAESPVREASYFHYFGRDYWGVGPYLGEFVDRQIREPAIVFVHFREPKGDSLPIRYLCFGSAMARQLPFLDRARVIYARDLGGGNKELVARFPGRRAYLYRGSLQAGTLEELPRPE